MPGKISHPVLASHTKALYEDDSYHTVDGVADTEVLITTDVIDTPAASSTLPISAGHQYVHENDTHAHGNEVPYTVAEKEKLAGLNANSNDCFSMMLGAYAWSPTDSLTYYFGGAFSRVPSTTANISRVYIPRVGTSHIRAAHVVFNVTSTLGTTEAISVYVRVNDTTDYLISAAATMDAAVCHVKSDTLEIPVTCDDYIEIKLVCPAWATNPSTVYTWATLWLDAMPAAETPPAPPGGAATSLYGILAYDGTEPLGGGAGYSDIKTTGDHVITSAADFIAHMVGGASPATTGQVVFIPGNLEIDLTSYVTSSSIYIPEGVIVASDRGEAGSLGALLKHTSMTMGYVACLRANGHNVRLTGVRLRGADPNYGTSGSQAPHMTGFSCNGKQGVHVDNCEIYQWNYAGITNYTDLVATTAGVVDWAKAAHIKCNYIHHCRRPSQGYGITVAKSSTLIELNIFNACRHCFSGDRDNSTGATPAGDETYVEFRYNQMGFDTYESNGTCFDHHGGSDTTEEGYGSLPSMTGIYNLWAGGEIWVHHNDFRIAGENAVSIRGVPRFTWTIEYNWFVNNGSDTSYSGTIRQRLYTIPITPGDTAGPHYSDAPPFVHEAGEDILVDNNWWGATAPPAAPPPM
jgi:hypothetical protein